MELYSDLINFEIIYIREAHAQDVWPISSGRFNKGRGPIIVYTPNNTNERVLLASKFVEDFPTHSDIHVLVDSLDHGDLFLQRFAPWPIRIYLLRVDDVSSNPVVEFIFDPENATIPFEKVFKKLQELRC